MLVIDPDMIIRDNFADWGRVYGAGGAHAMAAHGAAWHSVPTPPAPSCGAKRPTSSGSRRAGVLRLLRSQSAPPTSRRYPPPCFIRPNPTACRPC